MNLFPDMEAIPQVVSPTYSYMFGNDSEVEDMLISSSDVEIIEPPPPEIIEISPDSIVVVNIVDISSSEGSPWIPMLAWSPAYTLTPEFGSSSISGDSVRSQMSNLYYEYHYRPMPTESELHQDNSSNEEAINEVGMKVNQEGGTMGMTMRESTSGEPSQNVAQTHVLSDVPATEDCIMCGFNDHPPRAYTRVRSQPELGRFAFCTMCRRNGHFAEACSNSNVVRPASTSDFPPADSDRSAPTAMRGTNRRTRAS
ncbi:hypothetical protein Rs2_28793 [Raphanus sativus]|nr:hypothetical protein Rs2_28793 [Raphanus sativus]